MKVSYSAKLWAIGGLLIGVILGAPIISTHWYRDKAPEPCADETTLLYSEGAHRCRPDQRMEVYSDGIHALIKCFCQVKAQR